MNAIQLPHHPPVPAAREEGPANPRLLVLGGGAVVAEYYMPALRQLGFIDGVMICDASVTRVAALRARDRGIRVEQADFRQALADDHLRARFDAAVIALPNAYHEEAAAAALGAGLHVLCEKPLALTAAACRRLAYRAEAQARVLSVGMTRRLLPSVRAVRDALSTGLIGELIRIDIEDGAPYAWNPASDAPFQPENGGVLADMGTHYLDLIEHLVGPLTPKTYEDDSAGGVEANAEFALETGSGVPVRVRLSRTHHLRNTMMLRGRRGHLVLEKDATDSVLWRSGARGLHGRLFAAQAFNRPGWSSTFESCFAQQFLDFAQLIQGKDAPHVDAQQAASTTSLIEWAYGQRRMSRGQARHPKEVARPSPSPALTVVTGGTGFIGVNLVQRLAELGFTRIALPVRNYRSCAAVARFPVDIQRLELLDYEEVQQAMAGARHVFHLAYGRDGANARRVTVDGTRNVVEAAIAAGAESVVVLSTGWVFGHPDTPAAVDETWPYAPAGGEYGRSKAEMERWCLERARSSLHTRIVVLNPSCVYGPWGRTYTTMPVKLAQDGSFCWIEEGRGIANYTYVDNLVDAMVLAATFQEAHGRRFIINDGSATWHTFLIPLLGRWAEQLPSYTGKELQALHREQRARLLDMARIVASDPGLRAAIATRPAMRGALRLIAKRALRVPDPPRAAPEPALETRSGRTQGPPLPPVWLADLFGPGTTVLSSRNAQEMLGWRPLVDLQEGQQRALAWLQASGCLREPGMGPAELEGVE